MADFIEILTKSVCNTDRHTGGVDRYTANTDYCIMHGLANTVFNFGNSRVHRIKK